MLEYEKFQDMQAKMNRLQEEYDRRLQEKNDSRERALQELTEYFETRVQDMTAKLEQVCQFQTKYFNIRRCCMIANVILNTFSITVGGSNITMCYSFYIFIMLN